MRAGDAVLDEAAARDQHDPRDRRRRDGNRLPRQLTDPAASWPTRTHSSARESHAERYGDHGRDGRQRNVRGGSSEDAPINRAMWCEDADELDSDCETDGGANHGRQERLDPGTGQERDSRLAADE